MEQLPHVIPLQYQSARPGDPGPANFESEIESWRSTVTPQDAQGATTSRWASLAMVLDTRLSAETDSAR